MSEGREGRVQGSGRGRAGHVGGASGEDPGEGLSVRTWRRALWGGNAYTGVGTLEAWVPGVGCIWGLRGERGAKVNVAMKSIKGGIGGLEAELPWKRLGVPEERSWRRPGEKGWGILKPGIFGEWDTRKSR